MYEIYERIPNPRGLTPGDSLELDHLEREKSRLRCYTHGGVEARLFLARGEPLQPGDLLRSRCGTLIAVQGRAEPLLRAECDDWPRFARACYHLGNRHVRLQIGERWLRIKPDHVLQDMLVSLGLQVREEQAVFEPEPGAYGHGHQHHAH